MKPTSGIGLASIIQASKFVWEEPGPSRNSDHQLGEGVCRDIARLRSRVFDVRPTRDLLKSRGAIFDEVFALARREAEEHQGGLTRRSKSPSAPLTNVLSAWGTVFLCHLDSLSNDTGVLSSTARRDVQFYVHETLSFIHAEVLEADFGVGRDEYLIKILKQDRVFSADDEFLKQYLSNAAVNLPSLYLKYPVLARLAIESFELRKYSKPRIRIRNLFQESVE
jgi:hypothetical protein